jgi:uncharacterized LabA/DUF88 family protein
MFTAYAYIDAAYIRAELRKADQAEDFNPRKLFNYLRAENVYHDFIRADRMFFYDAIDENASTEAQVNKQAYLKKVEELPYVSVVTGFVRPGKKKQQKSVDVQIACDALLAAASHQIQAVILVAGDADFCPLADAVRRTGTFFIALGYADSFSVELRHSADYASTLPPVNEGYLPAF